MRLQKEIKKNSGIIKLEPKVGNLMMELGFSSLDYFDKNELKRLRAQGNIVSEYLRMCNGGLGILQGDMAKSAADLGIPIAFVLPYYPKGFGKQKISEQGDQIWEDNPLDISKHFNTIDDLVDEHFGPTHLQLKGHLSWLVGENKEGPRHALPILLLDYTSSGNNKEFLESNRLYLGQKINRLCQEIVLGACGVKASRKLWNSAERFQLNDSHPAFAVIEVLYKQFKNQVTFDEASNNVRNMVSMTTHTPVSAAWDSFPYEMVFNEFGGEFENNIKEVMQSFNSQEISLGFLGLWGSGYINAVSKQNAIVAQHFKEVGKLSRTRPNFRTWTNEPPTLNHDEWTIDYITNGVYHPTWVSDPYKKLFDKRLGNWVDNPTLLAKAPLVLQDGEVWNAHIKAKQIFFEYLRKELGIKFDVHALTYGFARRFASYKRADLIFHDVNRLKKIAKEWYKKTGKPLQIVMAGIAFPSDEEGKALLKKVYQTGYELNKEPYLRYAFMPNYRTSNSRIMIAGVDVWVNSPFRPKEASGTSGMKAALNGVLNLSVDDGWWSEGSRTKPEAGWVVGGEPQNYVDESLWQKFVEEDSESLYKLMIGKVPHTFYYNKPEWIHKEKESIALGAYFNTHRVIVENCIKSWGLGDLIKQKGLEKLIKKDL